MYPSLPNISYEMLVGLPPFYRNSEAEAYQAITAYRNETFSKQIDFPKDLFLSQDAKDLLKNLLHEDPKSRLGSKKGCAEILAHPWFSGIEAEKLRKHEITLESYKKRIKSLTQMKAPFFPMVQ